MNEDNPKTTSQTISKRADEIEYQQMQELGERIVTKSLLFNLADGEVSLGNGFGQGTGKQLLMGEDPRLPKMPDKPTLLDFFKYRFDPSQQHLLQSANLARKNGLSKKWCWPASCTISRWSGSSVPITAIGALS